MPFTPRIRRDREFHIQLKRPRVGAEAACLGDIVAAEEVVAPRAEFDLLEAVCLPIRTDEEAEAVIEPFAVGEAVAEEEPGGASAERAEGRAAVDLDRTSVG